MLEHEIQTVYIYRSMRQHTTSIDGSMSCTDCSRTLRHADFLASALRGSQCFSWRWTVSSAPRTGHPRVKKSPPGVRSRTGHARYCRGQHVSRRGQHQTNIRPACPHCLQSTNDQRWKITAITKYVVGLNNPPPREKSTAPQFYRETN
jgi:hypothetical protein